MDQFVFSHLSLFQINERYQSMRDRVLPPDSYRDRGVRGARDGSRYFLNFIFLVGIICQISIAQDSKEYNPIKLIVEDVQDEIPITAIKSVDGFVGDRLLKNKNNYLKTFPIEEHVQFIEERTHKEWDWKKAEQPGKWIESSLITAMRFEDEELDIKVHEM